LTTPSHDPLSIAFEVGAVKRRAVHGATATLVGQIIKFLLLFGSQFLLVRLLAPAEFGLIAMVGPVLYFVMALNDLGLGQATIQRADITRLTFRTSAGAFASN
jgi:PST family polysaccharide transporter